MNRCRVASTLSVGGAAAACAVLARRWHLRWGATDRECREVLSGDELIAREETRALVNLTIAELPQSYQSVLKRKYISGRSVGQLSKELNLSNEATKSLLARARRAFKRKFEFFGRDEEVLRVQKCSSPLQGHRTQMQPVRYR